MSLQTINTCAFKYYYCIWLKRGPIDKETTLLIPGAVYSTMSFTEVMTQSLQLLGFSQFQINPFALSYRHKARHWAESCQSAKITEAAGITLLSLVFLSSEETHIQVMFQPKNGCKPIC